MMKREAQRIADFDPDAIYQYTITRPVTNFGAHRRRVLRWPEFSFFVIRAPEAGHDLALLLGPEPDLRWKECIEAVAGFSARLGVQQAFTLGAYYGPVHYAAPPPVVGIATDPQLRHGLQRLGVSDSDYEGPTGFVTGVSHALAGRGVPAASLWVAAPAYLQNITNPALSVALLTRLEALLGQSLWLGELEVAGRDASRRIEEALRARPDILELLQRLSGSEAPDSEAPAAPSPAEEPAELPSAADILKDLEDYLHRSQGGQSDASGPPGV
jgi:proteasome assembly chaperone (PAC2) family protein